MSARVDLAKIGGQKAGWETAEFRMNTRMLFPFICLAVRNGSYSISLQSFNNLQSVKYVGLNIQSQLEMKTCLMLQEESKKSTVTN